MAGTEEGRPTGGALSVAISNGMVRLLRQYTGRGPTKARTSVGRDHVLIVVRDALTPGERTLVDAGFTEQVLLQRRNFQKIMQDDATSMVETLTGRKVIGFMSDNHADPDLGVEVFVLAPNHDDGSMEEGDSTEAH